MAGALSGETAIIEAAAILAAGAADRILVLAGDCLTRPLYHYYEAAGVLDPACFDADTPEVPPERRHRVPGEGLVACLLETEESAAARERARSSGATWAAGSEPSDLQSSDLCGRTISGPDRSPSTVRRSSSLPPTALTRMPACHRALTFLAFRLPPSARWRADRRWACLEEPDSGTSARR